MNDDALLEDLFSWDSASSETGKLTTSSVSPNIIPSSRKETLGPTGSQSSIQEESTSPDPVASLNIPSGLNERLFDFQKEGIQWLYRKHRKSRACLLADEMGLGKTVQVCTFLGALYKQKLATTTIIVVPTTLVPIWSSALLEWGILGSPIVEVMQSDARGKRTSKWKKLKLLTPTVILTTYGILRQDAALASASMVDYVILDEAHLIKDPATNAFKSALQLSARHKIALTGTPLMNRFDDLWSIFQFLDGSIMGTSRANFSTVSATLLRGNEKDATESMRSEAAAELVKLQAMIQPFMLRREKKDLAHILDSTKLDRVVWVKLSDTQRRLYQSFLDSRQLPAEASGGPVEETNPLLLLTTLTQLCAHPWLALTEQAFETALQNPSNAVCEEVGPMLSGSKLCVALALIRSCAEEGRKSLVFSRSKRLLHMLARCLTEQNISFLRVDGDVMGESRCRIVDRFNADPTVTVCLLTTQVGGVGLTFQGASAVILLEPSWNPAADQQAVDRVHRVGQSSRSVRIYRLVTCGTVEEKIYRNQVFKLMASRQATIASRATTEEVASEPSNGADFHRYFTRMQLRCMFDMGDLDESQTAQQLAELHPDPVVQEERDAMVNRIPNVCDVSDYGCVMSDELAQSNHHVEDQPTTEEEIEGLIYEFGRAEKRERSDCEADDAPQETRARLEQSVLQ